MTPTDAPPAPLPAPAREAAVPGGRRARAASAAALRFLVRSASWGVALGALAMVLAAVVVPRLTGATPYTVLTGSMSPAYPPGTLVVVRPTPVARIGIGDVVTYQLRSGEPTVVTHRVVGLGRSPQGPTLVTRGDANPVVDPEPVRPVQVRGTVWYALPQVGRVGLLATPGQHELGVRVAAGLLIAWALGLVVRAHRTGRSS